MSATLAPDVAAPTPALDDRIIKSFADGANWVEVKRLLPEVQAAANAADVSAGEARARALDPLCDDVKRARRELEDANFTRDRLQEAGKKLAERIKTLQTAEADFRMYAEHERISAERDRLAEEMLGMVEPIARIAHTVSRIDICDREARILNATAAAKFGHIASVMSGAPRVITTLFQDDLVFADFCAVAKLPIAGAKDKAHAKK
jgi:ParB-like chromosome segregation protein Spo0J